MRKVMHRLPEGTAVNLELDFSARPSVTVSPDNPDRNPPKSREELITACGQTRMNRNDEEEVLWLARLMGGIIGDPGRPAPSQSELGNLLSLAYSQYVIASRLRPIMDAKPFIEEARRAAEKLMAYTPAVRKAEIEEAKRVWAEYEQAMKSEMAAS